MALADFNARYDVSFDATHNMYFYPVVLFFLFAILGIEPARELARSEARRVNREVGFNALEWQS
jgi:hypothetical protein